MRKRDIHNINIYIIFFTEEKISQNFVASL